MLKTIYSIKPRYEVYPNAGVCKVYLTFQNKTYRGLAELSPEDKDFFSEKVGLNIALSRARIKLLKDLVKEAEFIFNIKYQMYEEALNYSPFDIDLVDPTGNFYKKVLKASTRVTKLKKYSKSEQQQLKQYLKNQSKLVEGIKKIRARDKEE